VLPLVTIQAGAVGFGPLSTIRAFADSGAYFFFFHYAFALAYLACRLRTVEVATLRDAWGLLRRPEYWDVALLAAMCLAGAIPVLFITTGSRPFFFSLQQIYLAMPLLAAWLAVHVGKVNFSLKLNFKMNIGVLALWLLVLAVGMQLTANWVRPLVRLGVENVSIRMALVDGAAEYKGPAEIVSDMQGLLRQLSGLGPESKGALLQARKKLRSGDVAGGLSEMGAVLAKAPSGMESLANMAVLRILLNLERQPEALKAHWRLLIPPENDGYWGLLRECGSAPFLAQALSGVTLSDGLPPSSCPGSLAHAIFGRRHDHESDVRASAIDICARAAVDQVRVLRLEETPGGGQRLVSLCGVTPGLTMEQPPLDSSHGGRP